MELVPVHRSFTVYTFTRSQDEEPGVRVGELYTGDGIDVEGLAYPKKVTKQKHWCNEGIGTLTQNGYREDTLVGTILRPSYLPYSVRSYQSFYSNESSTVFLPTKYVTRNLISTSLRFPHPSSLCDCLLLTRVYK